jgi:retinoblastoma-associated protein
MCDRLKCNDGAASSADVSMEQGHAGSGAPPPTKTLPTATISLGDDYLVRTRGLGVALFWQTLQNILEAEEKRLKKNVFTNLLNNRGFHKALFACSLEAMLKAHSLMPHLFPRTMQDFGLTAEDLAKVVDSFLKNANLPAMLSDHLGNVKMQIFFQWVWKDESFLIGLFRKNAEYDAAVAAAANNAQEGAKPPAKKTAQDNRDEKVLEMFQKTTFRIAVERNAHICRRINLPAAIVEKISSVLYSVVNKHAIELLKNRNVDVAILCSIYGVCKVQKMNITFDALINSYKKCSQQSCVTHIVRGIELTKAGEDGSIVDYYNRVFVPVMKALILSMPQSDATTTANMAKVCVWLSLSLSGMVFSLLWHHLLSLSL